MRGGSIGLDIFGSGFLVIVPILNGAVGPYSLVAMAGVCAIAYAMGSVIRFNIRNVEPVLEAGTAPARLLRWERTANLALVLAYAISVCLYIHILAAFLLGGLGINTPRRENIITVIVIELVLAWSWADSVASICSWSWSVGLFA